ncbi:MAG: F0F1 ATP synthase subunit delta [Halobacteriovoraceae bacterium]|nr:F0F1 ATP synthase subunit delta [Halobacteriovoraceae bacterium]
MKERDIARVYAKSIISLAKSNKIDLIPEFSKIVDVLNMSEDLEKVLFLDAFREDEKLSVFKVIAEKISLSPLMNNFMEFLIREKRASLFNIIYKEVVIEDDREKGFIHGVIEGSEAEISPEVKNKFKVFLKNKLGREPELEYKQSDRVTAGYRVSVEDLLLDASLDNQLENFRKTIMI